MVSELKYMVKCFEKDRFEGVRVTHHLPLKIKTTIKLKWTGHIIIIYNKGIHLVFMYLQVMTLLKPKTRCPPYWYLCY